MISDPRRINYLPISVTDRCNFRCIYCVPSNPFNVIPHEKIARYEELLRITRIATQTGITKVRITGGEPFARKDIMTFLEKLCSIESLKDISITTNGALLSKDKIDRLLRFGIRRMNFSMDTLNPEKFKKITKRDAFYKVKKNILMAHDMGISPIKINTVVLKGINDDEIEQIAHLTFLYPFHIRFIEYMPMGDTPIEKSKQMLTREIMDIIEKKYGILTPVAREFNDGPAKKFRLKDARGVVGFITPISSHFCSTCNRLRLTSRGTLRPCLLHNYEKDILTPLREGATDDELKEVILCALARKPAFHTLNNRDARDIPISHMTSIGG
jgi:cyclic pyranopterin phosphate synthase